MVGTLAQLIGRSGPATRSRPARVGWICLVCWDPIPLLGEIGCGLNEATSRESAGPTPDGISLANRALPMLLHIVAIDVRGLAAGPVDGGDVAWLHLL